MTPECGTVLAEPLNRAKPLHSQRDALAHATWLPADIRAYVDGEDADRYYGIRPRRYKDRLSGRIYNLTDLASLVKEIESLNASLQKYLEDFVDSVEWHEDG